MENSIKLLFKSLRLFKDVGNNCQIQIKDLENSTWQSFSGKIFHLKKIIFKILFNFFVIL